MRLHRHSDISQSPLRLEECDPPDPGPYEVLVSVRACGICHTDLHLVEGELPERALPVTPGHQVVGVVERAGPEVTHHQPGDRVGIPWLNVTCRSLLAAACRYCERGQENLCERGRFTGYDVDGGYAEYLKAHEDCAYPLPPAYSDEAVAPLLCAGVIGYRALRLSGATAGDALGLYGFGSSAHIVIQLAVDQGMRVLVYTRSEEHQALALELGAEWVGQAQAGDPESLDAAIVFAPAGWIVPHTLEALRKGGTAALAGIHMTDVPQIPYRLLYGERCLKTVANSTRADVTELLDAAARAEVTARIETFPLEEANEALAKLKSGGIDGSGVLKVS
ncbi:MAG: zinc-dependent alcohol dehydrogenase family protein [Chloroflexota bacterium]